MKRRELLASVSLSSLSLPAWSASSPSDVTHIASPDNGIQLEFSLAPHFGRAAVATYSVFFKSQPLVAHATLGLQLAGSGFLGSDLKILQIENRRGEDRYTLFPGKTSSVHEPYRELIVSLAESLPPRRRFDLLFRVYNDGVAFRYRFPQQSALPDLTVTAEHSRFSFAGDPLVYALPLRSFYTPYEAYYQRLPLKSISSDPLLALPLLLEFPQRAWLAISEADLTDYAGLYLSGDADSAGTLISRLSQRPGDLHADDLHIKVKASLPHLSPWRVLMISDDIGRLIESNLITNLNRPSAFHDTSWIKPGKTTFPWWNGYAAGNAGFKVAQNTETHKYYIDFCAENGIPYHSLDGLDNIAWYGGTIVPYTGADITTSLPEIDLPAVIAYARQKNVRLRFWMHWAAAQAHMHHAFPLYQQWGIEGVMIDFIERDDQEMINFLRELIELAAKHHLTVTLHNVSKPTGLHRTYPNLMTLESVFNAEYNKWDPRGSTPEHQLIIPFVRMLAGPMDYHSGSFHNVAPQAFKPRNVAPMTMGTRSRELARYVVYEGYLPMIADYPDAYRHQPGFDFLQRVPTSWDQTKVLHASIGDHLTIARRHGSQWYVGTMTAERGRQLPLSLKFLPAGKFTAEIYRDDPAAPEQPEKLLIERKEVTSTDIIPMKLAPAGGHAVILSPVRT